MTEHQPGPDGLVKKHYAIEPPYTREMIQTQFPDLLNRLAQERGISPVNLGENRLNVNFNLPDGSTQVVDTTVAALFDMASPQPDSQPDLEAQVERETEFVDRLVTQVQAHREQRQQQAIPEIRDISDLMRELIIDQDPVSDLEKGIMLGFELAEIKQDNQHAEQTDDLGIEAAAKYKFLEQNTAILRILRTSENPLYAIQVMNLVAGEIKQLVDQGSTLVELEERYVTSARAMLEAERDNNQGK